MRNFNLYFAPIFMAIVLLLVLTLPVSAQGIPCAPTERADELHAEWGMELRDTQEDESIPGGRADLLVNTDDGRFLIVFYPQGGITCMAQRGVNPAFIETPV